MANTSEVIKLEYPITINGQEVKTITIRRPKVKDQTRALKLKGSDAEQEIKMFSDLCMITVDAMEELDLKDYMQIREMYESFLSSPRKTPAVDA